MSRLGSIAGRRTEVAARAIDPPTGIARVTVTCAERIDGELAAILTSAPTPLRHKSHFRPTSTDDR